MEEYLDGNIKLKIKGLAYYQILSGLFGLGLTVLTLSQHVTTNRLLILTLTGFITLFCFSVVCGLLLLRKDLKLALKLSTLNQALQVFSVALFGYSFKYVAGLLLSLGIDLTDGFNIKFNFSIPAFQADLNTDSDALYVGFNLVAIYLIYYIDKLQKDLSLKKELYDASRSLTTEVRT
jgi:hypothetical protein